MVRPLDKIAKGKRLVRDASIEAQIESALQQDLDTLRRRAAIRDKTHSEYLSPECLVHLVRHAIRTSNAEGTHNTWANALLPFLLARCAANLNAKVSPDIPGATELRKDILAEFGLLFASERVPNGKWKLDFFEVRFNRAFQVLRIDAVRQELARLNHLAEPAPISGDPNDDPTLSEFPASLSEMDAIDLDAAIFTKQMAPKLAAALKELPANERTAVILYHRYGRKIESEDPTENTIATHCDVSGRTVRNWLRRAMAKLSKLKELA